MTPDANDLCVFAVKRGDIEKRIDPHSNHPKFQVIFNRLKKYAVLPLKDYATNIFSGITPKSGGDAYTESEDGVLFVKSGCLSNDGYITIDETSRIKHETHNGLMKSSQLRYKDVLIAIVGATIGKVGLFDLTVDANINQAIAAVRLNDNLLPEFLVAYLLSPIGQTYLEFLKRPVARANINLQEIGEIGIPLLSVDQQERFINLFYYYRDQKEQKLKQADELLSKTSDFIHSTLGIHKIANTRPMVFAVAKPNAMSTRIDPEYHNPYYTHRVAEIKKISWDKLGNIIEFSTEAWDQKSIFEDCFPYIEIANVRLKGNAYKTTVESVIKAPSRAKMIVRNGDIIVSTTRPQRGAIATICCEENEVLIASTGFCVLRTLKRDDVLKEYLQWILLDEYVLSQMLQRSSGGNYPAITSDELKQVVIPIPEISIQRKICEEVEKRRIVAERLRNEAELEWKAAKEQFEKELLGE